MGTTAGKAARQGRLLIIRFSSLGDVILATSALQALRAQGREPADWLVAAEYADLFRRHPMVRKVWVFDRKAGLKGLVALWWRHLRREKYIQILDLHGSLRSRLVRLLFASWGVARLSPPAGLWVPVSKQRLRMRRYFRLKEKLPLNERPEPFVARFGKMAGGTGRERPDLTGIFEGISLPEELEGLEGQYLCVMPGARWPGKKWPASSFAKLLDGAGTTIVVLGSSSDRESLELVERLRNAGGQTVSGVGKWSLGQGARVLASSLGYFGNDTGMAHLAEAVGVPAAVVFGPTQPDMGFGPWRPESLSLGMALECRPCSKDGQGCYRPASERFLCLTGLRPEMIEADFLAWLEARKSKRKARPVGPS